jgi:hypothetical protein
MVANYFETSLIVLAENLSDNNNLIVSQVGKLA